ncbi:MAG: phosphonate C-P lyase system protein PhnH, partial [Pseudomonadota bacterium]
PGRIETASGAMPPAPLSVAAGTLLLTLADPETPIYLVGGVDTPEVRGWLAFHTGAPLAGPDRAVFAVGRWDDLTPLEPYRIGTADYPDRSATLIIECDRLTAEGTRLTGPGIRDQAHLPLPDAEAFARNRARYPLGLDFYLTCGDRIAGLPRSTRIG